MNVKKLLKYRTTTNTKTLSEDPNLTVDVDNEEEPESHNFKTELYNIFLIGLCFCLLMGGYNTLSQNLVLELHYNDWLTLILILPGIDLLLCWREAGRLHSVG